MPDESKQTKLRGIGSRINVEQFLTSCQIRIDAGLVHMQQVCKRMIDDLDHTHQDDDLDRQRQQTRQRIIFFPFIDFRLLLCDRIFIAVEFHLQPVYFRLHFYNLQPVFVCPDTYRQQNNLADQCEQDNCQPVMGNQ